MSYAFFNLILQTLVISVYAHFNFGGVLYHIWWTDKLKLHRGAAGLSRYIICFISQLCHYEITISPLSIIPLSSCIKFK